MLYEIGVVIGKFYPLHKGHQHLIDTAKNKVKHLYIIICGKYDEHPKPEIRELLIKKLYNDPKITVCRIIDIGYDPDNSKLWADLTKQTIGCCPNIVFTSENYGDEYAKQLGCIHELVDINRINVPICGTSIRHNPYKYWDFLDKGIAEFYTTRFVFVGAESTGKTTMSSKLAKELDLAWVPEYGREYCENNNMLFKNWVASNFDDIANKQNEIENITAGNNIIIICDTDSRTTGAWYERYLKVEKDYENTYEPYKKIYFFSDVNNTELIDDGTRKDSNEQIRLWMHSKILEKINKSGNKVIMLSGSYDERYNKAKVIVKEHIDYINKKINSEIIEIDEIIKINETSKLFNCKEYIVISIFCVISIIFSFVNITPGEQLSFINLNDNITWEKIVFLLSGIVSFTGVLSVIFASKENKYTFIFGIINSITFGLYSYAYSYVGNFQLFIMYFLPLQFYGIYEWNNNNDNNTQIKKIQNKSTYVAFTYLCFILWIIFYFEIPGFTKFITNTDYPYETNILPRILDSGNTSISIIAQWLLINKYYECWILWIIVNIFQIIMFSGINGYISVNIIIMTGIYQLNAFYGLYLWKNKLVD